MKRIKISIITASFNAVQTIGGTIESVLSQKHDNLEYIVIDGGSSDGTMDVVDRYKNQLSHVLSEPDRGIYDAFNKGLRLATGDIIGILNADDFYAPWALETVASAYRNNPDADVLYGKVVSLDEEQKKWFVYPLGNPENLVCCMSLSHPAIFVTRKAYEQYGLFDDSFKCSGDWDLLLRLYLAGANFCPVDDVLTAFRTSGMSSRSFQSQLRENARLLWRHLKCSNALHCIVKMYAKYGCRFFLKTVGAYGVYATYRDRNIYHLQMSGNYDDNSEEMWNSIRLQSLHC